MSAMVGLPAQFNSANARLPSPPPHPAAEEEFQPPPPPPPPPRLQKRVCAIEPGPIIETVAAPIRERTEVSLPLFQYRTFKLQSDFALQSMSESVATVRDAAAQTHTAAGNLSQNVRSLVEKASEVSQRAEAVIAKVTVMDDWVSELGKTGSGLKIQMIEYVMKIVYMLIGVLSFLWHGMKKINVFKKTEPKPLVRRSKDSDDDDDDTERC
jgi:hypothetical protein